MAITLRLAAIALASTAAASTAALADTTCPPPGSPDAQVALIAQPNWIHRPSGEDMGRYYPPYAFKQGKSDQTEMECAVTDEGRLTGCKLVKDDKPSLGFGPATLNLAKVYQMPPLASIPEYAALPECVRKAGPPHVVIPVVWKTGGG